jgi:5-methyltetrahydrofolate--homocysteine methyltransferase
MSKAGLTIEETVRGAIDAAMRAKEGYPDRFVALDLGPTGKIFQPIGSSPFDEAYEHYKKQIRAAGDRIDLIAIETVSDLTEMRAAIYASKDLTDLPVFAAMTFTAKERTWLGTTLEQWAELAEHHPPPMQLASTVR